MSQLDKEWLLSAEMDIRNIEKIIDDEFLSPIICFHAQQCVEKCLKALLEANKIDTPKIHDLLRLFGILERVKHLEIDLNILQKLNDLYIETRYPNEFGLLPSGKPTLDDAGEFYEFAKMIYEKAKQMVLD
jgi:HEPN domain-containing protein